MEVGVIESLELQGFRWTYLLDVWTHNPLVLTTRITLPQYFQLVTLLYFQVNFRPDYILTKFSKPATFRLKN